MRGLSWRAAGSAPANQARTARLLAGLLGLYTPSASADAGTGRLPSAIALQRCDSISVEETVCNAFQMCGQNAQRHNDDARAG